MKSHPSNDSRSHWFILGTRGREQRGATALRGPLEGSHGHTSRRRSPTNGHVCDSGSSRGVLRTPRASPPHSLTVAALLGLSLVEQVVEERARGCSIRPRLEGARRKRKKVPVFRSSANHRSVGGEVMVADIQSKLQVIKERSAVSIARACDNSVVIVAR